MTETDSAEYFKQYEELTKEYNQAYVKYRKEKTKSATYKELSKERIFLETQLKSVKKQIRNFGREDFPIELTELKNKIKTAWETFKIKKEKEMKEYKEKVKLNE